jgi:serine/threonine protein kinase
MVSQAASCSSKSLQKSQLRLTSHPRGSQLEYEARTSSLPLYSQAITYVQAFPSVLGDSCAVSDHLIMIASFLCALLFSARVVHSLDAVLTLYTSNKCKTPGTTSPNVTLGLNVCAITTGMESFLMRPIPCTSGNIKAWIFTDTVCGKTTLQYDAWDDGCYDAWYGAIAAIMLTCGDPGTSDFQPESEPTATTSFAVGEVATPPPATRKTAASSTSTRATVPSGTEADNGSSAASGFKSGWSGLSYAERIGIIVSLSIGIPSVVIALLTYMATRKRLG